MGTGSSYAVRIRSTAPILAGGSLAVEAQLTSDSGQAAPVIVFMSSENPVDDSVAVATGMR